MRRPPAPPADDLRPSHLRAEIDRGRTVRLPSTRTLRERRAWPSCHSTPIRTRLRTGPPPLGGRAHLPWLHRFRRVLVRYERRAEIREADAELAVARLQVAGLETRIAVRPMLEEHLTHAQVAADVAHTGVQQSEQEIAAPAFPLGGGSRGSRVGRLRGQRAVHSGRFGGSGQVPAAASLDARPAASIRRARATSRVVGSVTS